MSAWFWLIAWGLWCLVMSMGAQGFSPVMSLIGLLALPKLADLRWPVPLDVLAFLVFLAWCVATALWSPYSTGSWITIDPGNENYAVDSPGLRITLVSLLCMLGFWRLYSVDDKFYRRVRAVGPITIGLQMLVFLSAVLAFDVFRSFFSFSDDFNIGQNMIRSVNMAILALPLLFFLIPREKLSLRLISVLAASVICIVYAARVDGKAAIVAFAVIIAIASLTRLMGRSIFRLLGYGTAIVIVTMPFAMDLIIDSAAKMDQDSIPLSYASRLFSYDFVIDKIQEKWLLGWGVEASKQWKETTEFIVNGTTVQYPIVPGHPHNAPLQIWAETGLVGVLLLSAFTILLGERFARSDVNNPQVLIPGACLWGGSLVYAAMSYSVWNDAYWAGVLFLATGVLALSKLLPKVKSPE